MAKWEKIVWSAAITGKGSKSNKRIINKRGNHKITKKKLK
jgi:hypothetical protein